ncbi:hypothetical protein RTBOTA2_004895 [Rhodotorula toruloides]|nr:hypothetical protein RTBOTA2_004895 [Rhodotorula toruloides]
MRVSPRPPTLKLVRSLVKDSRTFASPPNFTREDPLGVVHLDLARPRKARRLSPPTCKLALQAGASVSIWAFCLASQRHQDRRYRDLHPSRRARESAAEVHGRGLTRTAPAHPGPAKPASSRLSLVFDLLPLSASNMHGRSELAV